MVVEFIPTKRDISSRELFLNDVKLKYIHHSKLSWIKQDRRRQLGLTKSKTSNAQRLTAKDYSNTSNIWYIGQDRISFSNLTYQSLLIHCILFRKKINSYIEVKVYSRTLWQTPHQWVMLAMITGERAWNFNPEKGGNPCS